MMDFSKNSLASIIVAEHEREFERRAAMSARSDAILTRPGLLRRLAASLAGARPAARQDVCTTCAA